MTTVLLLLLAATPEPTGKLKLAGAPLEALKKASKVMRDAGVTNDAQALIDTMYPGAVKLLGTPKEAVATTAEMMAEQKRSPVKLVSADVADPHFCTRVKDGTLQCVLKQTNHYLVEGTDRVFTVADVIAISSDKGVTWTFLSASENTLERLRKALPELSPDLPIVPQAAPAPEPK